MIASVSPCSDGWWYPTCSECGAVGPTMKHWDSALAVAESHMRWHSHRLIGRTLVRRGARRIIREVRPSKSKKPGMVRAILDDGTGTTIRG